jgi:hypothetical protein
MRALKLVTLKIMPAISKEIIKISKKAFLVKAWSKLWWKIPQSKL